MDDLGQIDTVVAPHRLSPAERERLESQGFLVRERSIVGADLDAIRVACEALVARLVEKDPGTPRIPAGSYLFQPHPELCTIVKWEPQHPGVVQGVEPFAHFDEALRAAGYDPRLVEPIEDLLGVSAVELFTEKLNLKRARVGGPIVLHQDYPYWTRNSEDPGQIATAILFLDDAYRGNGGLEVLPGSHKQGVQKGGAGRGFGALEMPPDAVSDEALVTLEVPAGSLVFFGSLLVHRSLPNESGGDRRTLLYSYQPAGRAPSVASLRRMLGR